MGMLEETLVKRWGVRSMAAVVMRPAGIGVALCLAGSMLGTPPSYAADPDAAAGGAHVVQAVGFTPAFERDAPHRSARSLANDKVVRAIARRSPATSVGTASLSAPEDLVAGDHQPAAADQTSVAPAADLAEGVAALTWRNAYPNDEFGVNATSGVLANRMLTATRNLMMYQRMPSASTIDYASTEGFFNVPAGEYYWTPKAYASLYKNRFIAVLPSFDSQSKDCLRGHLNIAVSKSSDPTKGWYRYRITQTDAWTDDINVGFSDNKVVLTVNEWDLSTSRSDCAGSTWEGARIKVVDWSDLLDGGSLTVRDVSPSTRTNYFGWYPITKVPTTSSTSSGTTVRLVGERKSTTWGDVAFATITGSAVSGTAKLASNLNLTSARGLAKLGAPPETIAAFPGGQHYLDERIMSATQRGNRLFFTSHATCKAAADTDFRSCARVVELNTSTTTPTVVEDALFVETGADTFLPFTGMARSGPVFFVMSRSSAVAPEPTDVYVTARDAGERIVGGALETRFYQGEARTEQHPGVSGSIVPDPVDTSRVFAQYSTVVEGWSAADDHWPASFVSRLQSNLSDAPAGSVVFGLDTGWWTSGSGAVRSLPSPTSPITWVRWSASPSTTDTPGGPLLTLGTTRQSVSTFEANFSDPAIGGTLGVSSFTAYVQWGTGDGRWSTPIAYPIQVDPGLPSIGGLQTRFRTGTVGKTVPVTFTWNQATDDLSGVHHIAAFIYDNTTLSDDVKATLPSTATSYAARPWLAAVTNASFNAVDRAGNMASVHRSLTTKAYQESSSTITWSSGWTSVSKSEFLKGAARYATKNGASARFTFSGRAVGFVTTKGPSRGKAEVWVDGVLAATVDLYASSTSYRQLAWQTSWPSYGSHTVRIKVLGTSGRPRVDVDGFVKF